jgi:hypothetical protein
MTAPFIFDGDYDRTKPSTLFSADHRQLVLGLKYDNTGDASPVTTIIKL